MSIKTCGKIIPEILEGYGTEIIFGIPGVHNIEMYGGLPQTHIQHITPRHEQGAGFMADGYARASGKPGVCFIITGPGMTNIATAMAQTMQDSIPMLVISSVNSNHQLALGEGRLHELPDQLALTSQVSVYNHRLTDVNNLPKVIARAFSIFTSQRPGPVHIEIPLDVLKQDASHIDTTPWPLPDSPTASITAIKPAVELLSSAQRPLMIIGGGAVGAAEPIVQVAEHFNIPVLNTNNGKGIVPSSHPLQVGATPSLECLREELENQADVILAIGTEFSETDYDFFFLGDLNINGKVIRIDIDMSQLFSNVKPDIPLLGDANKIMQLIATEISQYSTPQTPNNQRAAQLKNSAITHRDQNYQAFFDTITATVPEAIIVGDSTQPTYFAQAFYECEKPRRYFHSATGFGTLGYAFPATVGAKLAQPNLPVIGLIGDGGGQFTVNELASAVGINADITFIVWNNSGYGEIKRFMNEQDIPAIGVDIYTPSYANLAREYGFQSWLVESMSDFSEKLALAIEHRGPSLIEIKESGVVSNFPF